MKLNGVFLLALLFMGTVPAFGQQPILELLHLAENAKNNEDIIHYARQLRPFFPELYTNIYTGQDARAAIQAYRKAYDSSQAPSTSRRKTKP